MAINWSKIYTAHKGQWVALEKDEVTVVGHGKTPREALNRAAESGVKNPILTKVPRKVQTYVGSF